VRVRSVAWPPADLPSLPLGLPALATAVLALASFLLERARQTARGGGAVGVSGLALAWLAGAGFLALQALVWRQLWQQGLRLDSGPYGSVFFGLTGFHALHVLVGLGGLAGLILAGLAGRGVRYIPLRLWTLYLHMVGILWALVFASVYLL
jgi:cytochrome c oxidase subunit 3